jgi:hypothetical protein
MSDPAFPHRGEPVRLPCIWCGREPQPGEMTGPEAEGWDHTGICPECWDKTCKDPDDG